VRLVVLFAVNFRTVVLCFVTRIMVVGSYYLKIKTWKYRQFISQKCWYPNMRLHCRINRRFTIQFSALRLFSMTSMVKIKNLKIAPYECTVVETCGTVLHAGESHVKCDCLID